MTRVVRRRLMQRLAKAVRAKAMRLRLSQRLDKAVRLRLPQCLVRRHLRWRQRLLALGLARACRLLVHLGIKRNM
ncbi:hypothetical protein GUJ93_ZPchr0001g30197 [Zizania palustris]|uniref:Uncharacterized protein n=1 Tax=Zizania palustris TaxID=103762 RepID=A0A8J5S7Y3_ZIZPA|nr:hypothetical protein GUJ93_ZPchr0001g30197 [Zizania palustris]